MKNKIIDFHCHYGQSNDGNSVNFNKIKLHQERNNISRTILFPFTVSDLIKSSLDILQLSKKKKDIIPFLRFDPNKITTNQIEDLLKKGFKGVKLHPRAQKFDPINKKFFKMYEVIEKYKIPIIFHCKSYHFDPNSHPEKLLKIAKRFPKQIFVFGHFAGANKQLFKEFVKHKNIYVETSIDVTPNAYREVTLKYGFDRLIFGTDFPYSFGEIELLKLKFSNLPKNIVEKILYKNAQKILRIKN